MNALPNEKRLNLALALAERDVFAMDTDTLRQIAIECLTENYLTRSDADLIQDSEKVAA